MLESQKIIIITTRKPGHYKSYGQLIMRLLKGAECFEKVKFLRDMRCRTLVLIDGDGHHLVFLPLVILRSYFGLRSVYFSVRSEEFIDSGVKSSIKRMLAKIIVRCSHAKLISIHKPYMQSYVGNIVTDLIFDPQLWDLPVLDFTEELPNELASVSLDILSRAVLVLGSVNTKRSEDELLLAVKTFPQLNFVFAGKNDGPRCSRLAELPNVLLINRYVSDGEIIWLYRHCGFVYAYYDLSVNRPSGIFGRSVQLGRRVVVRRGGYLHKNFSHYSGLIAVESLDELPSLLSGFDPSDVVAGGCSDYNDMPVLISILSDQ
jgi:hypothetical protein